MADTEGKPTVTDPGNSMKVRFTDNSAKEGDFYPKEQIAKPLYLDPAGQPYAERKELEAYELGQDEKTDEAAKYDNEVWAIQERLKKALEASEAAGFGGADDANR